jgi:hypothetical protein
LDPLRQGGLMELASQGGEICLVLFLDRDYGKVSWISGRPTVYGAS